MENPALISLAVFAALMGLFVLLYLPRLRCYLAPFKPQERLFNPVTNRFAVLIPARDESQTIAGLLQTLDEQDYPKDRRDVYVIVKDPHDPTIGIAAAHGFKSLVCETQTRKGEALDYAFKALAKKQLYYDAYFIIDADCWMAPLCLRECNNALASGRDVVFCKKTLKNYRAKGKHTGPLPPLASGMVWTVIDELGNRYKSDRNLPEMTISTGQVLTRRVVERLQGFPFCQTLTEDMEFMFASPLYGFTHYYASRAVIYMEEAESLAETQKRHNRWVGGYVAAKRLYAARLKRKLRTPRGLFAYYLLDNLYLPFFFLGLAAAFALGTLLASAVFALLSAWNTAAWFLADALVAVGFVYLCFGVMTAFALAADRKTMNCGFLTKLALLFVTPLSYMLYFPVCYRALLGKPAAVWDPIARDPAAERKTAR